MICALCKKELPSGTIAPDREPVVTQGLCEECAFHLDARIGMPLQRFIEGLEGPVVVVDATGLVLGANQRACRLLGRDPVEVRDRLTGDVFECEYARLPGGCGRTVHCSGCAIRRTFEDTARTGASHLNVPAYIDQEDRRLSLRISTERAAGNIVLLRLDRLDAGPKA